MKRSRKTLNTKLRESRNITSLLEHEGTLFFKKVIKGPREDALRRFDNCVQWEKLCQKIPQVNSPKLMRADRNDLCLIYEWLENARSLEDCLNDKMPELEAYIVEAVKLLAILHTSEVNSVEIDNEKDLPNRKSLMLAIDKYDYASCTGAELELLSLLQQDYDFIEKIFNTEVCIETCLCHGDIRLDQFMYRQNQLWLIDFEELRMGDYTKDLAGILGSLYFNCLLKTFGSTTQETSDEIEVEAQFIERGIEYIEEMRPIIRSAYKTYSNIKKVDTIQLSTNIGWFIIERIMSRSKFSFRLSAIDKAILGIGREIIVSPNQLVELFD
ncbi:phosphotransferase [Staphylococcus schleiferi subsp. coagulans]|nr:phosphotransferase [Staphylococcus coagulans]